MISRVVSLPADGEDDLIVIAVGDRGVVDTRHQHFAALGEAPPLLLAFVGGLAVHGLDVQAVLAFVSGDQLLLLERPAQVKRVGSDAEVLDRAVAVGDSDLDRDTS